MDQSSTSTWVSSAAGGDPDALQRLIVHYHANLRRHVATQMDPTLRRHFDPDDVLQQAYVAAFRNPMKGCLLPGVILPGV